MSEAQFTHTRPALGIGEILSKTFKFTFSNIGIVTLLAIVPVALNYLTSGLLLGWNYALVGQFDGTEGPGFFFNFAISLIVGVLSWSIVAAVLTLYTYDVSLKNPPRISLYIQRALSVILPLIVLAVVGYLLVIVGFFLFIIPGLWLMAVLSVVVPAVVVESVGFGGLMRSANLTKEYRWPIVGALILMLILTFLISIAGTFVVSFLSEVVAGGLQSFLGLIVLFVGLSVMQAVMTAILSICVVIIYMRLREIKEGTTVEDIATVFE